MQQPQTHCFIRTMCVKHSMAEAQCAGRFGVGAACVSTERVFVCVIRTAVLQQLPYSNLCSSSTVERAVNVL